ncbi:hypothetical protein C8R45DRAFT_957285 [Mycena sanguinolenta]|nr:hypothetical protein C8R45DRAFT_957285 [Mycena sanguinolenta]
MSSSGEPVITPYIAPEFERKPSGNWFLIQSQQAVEFFHSTYSSLYIREEYFDLLHSIIEWAFRPLSNIQPNPPGSPWSLAGMEEACATNITTPTLLTSDDVLYHELGPVSVEHPPTNPFTEPKHQAPTHRRILITGIPGIGKSAFARFVISLRCMARLPTVHMSETSRLEVFHDGQRIAHKQVENVKNVICGLPKNTWILVDTNPNFAQVPPDVTDTRFFILQVMSPCPEYASWINKSMPKPVIIVMKPWTAEELIAARCCQVDKVSFSATDHQLQEFVELYGGSARDAYLSASKMAAHEKDVDAMLLEKSFTYPVPRLVPPGVSHIYLSVLPSVTESTPRIRKMMLTLPSTHIRDKIVRHVLAEKKHRRNEIWTALLKDPLGKSLAEVIKLNTHFHDLLLQDGSVRPDTVDGRL